MGLGLATDGTPMDLVFHSDRLTMTPYAESDIDLAIAMFTDPEVCRYGLDLMTEDEIRRDIGGWTRRGSNGCIGIWCVSLSDTGDKLGTVALLPMPVESQETDLDLVVPGEMPDADIEIGFYFKRSAWGMGYASEAAARLLAQVFTQSPLEEVVANFDPANTASGRVLEKVGFVDRGPMRAYGQDVAGYRTTREEWFEREAQAAKGQ